MAILSEHIARVWRTLRAAIRAASVTQCRDRSFERTQLHFDTGHRWLHRLRNYASDARDRVTY